MAEINATVLAKIFPHATSANIKKYAAHLQEQMQKYGITDVRAQRAFLANVGVESGELRYALENLNYSAAGLLRVFGKYFTQAQAEQYAHKPYAIASRVYANRLGNGSEASGDGGKYRGRGLIQITGKENYRLIGSGLGIDLVSRPEVLENAEFAVASACEYWRRRNLSAVSLNLVGRDEYAVFKSIRKKVNGGTNGLAESWQMYQLAKKVLL